MTLDELLMPALQCVSSPLPAVIDAADRVLSIIPKAHSDNPGNLDRDRTVGLALCSHNREMAPWVLAAHALPAVRRCHHVGVKSLAAVALVQGRVVYHSDVHRPRLRGAWPKEDSPGLSASDCHSGVVSRRIGTCADGKCRG